jgi:hypothetical protein
MSPIPIKKILTSCDFTPAERARLKQKLQARKAELEEAEEALDHQA